MSISGGRYQVLSGDERLDCALRGRLKKDPESPVSVGDFVVVERLADGSCRIRERRERTSALTRHGVARRREQVIAANIDQVAAVVSVARPDPDFRMVDRLLVLAELNEVTGLVVLNKCELGAACEALPDRFRPYRRAGYEVLATSAKTGTGLAELGERLADRTSVLSGPSGVGKSSLLNAIMPGLDLRVGEVGERSGRGRHTTVAASLHPLPGSGFVVDTPGLQNLALWEVDPRELSAAFPEMREAAAACRFGDCRHVAEPGCGVLDALASGEIDKGRYENYLSLREETEGG